LSSSLKRGKSDLTKDLQCRRQAELVEQKPPILLTIQALFVSYAPRFNSSQLFVVDPAFSNLIL
jgi:hypothetical protein